MMRFLPLFLFACFSVLAAFSLLRLQSAPTASSPWIGHTLPALRAISFSTGKAALVKEQGVTVLNIFASWCAPCIAEHPLFQRIAQEHHVSIVGLAWNDSREAVDAFLRKHGDPFDRVYLDNGTGTAVALGIRGVPETFIIDADGVVRFHHMGPLTEQDIQNDVLPLLKVLQP